MIHLFTSLILMACSSTGSSLWLCFDVWSLSIGDSHRWSKSAFWKFRQQQRGWTACFTGGWSVDRRRYYGCSLKWCLEYDSSKGCSWQEESCRRKVRRETSTLKIRLVILAALTQNVYALLPFSQFCFYQDSRKRAKWSFERSSKCLWIFLSSWYAWICSWKLSWYVPLKSSSLLTAFGLK